MSIYATIKDGVVTNTIVWDGPEKSPLEFPDGVIAVEVPDGTPVNAGFTYADGKFTAPPPSAEDIEYERTQALNRNSSSKQTLMNEASQRISVLQDAVDLEMATDEEAAALPLWKRYRVLLSRVDADTADDIKWPDKPQPQ